MKCEIFNIQESQCSTMRVGVGGSQVHVVGTGDCTDHTPMPADERSLGNTHLGEDRLTLLPAPPQCYL